MLKLVAKCALGVHIERCRGSSPLSLKRVRLFFLPHLMASPLRSRGEAWEKKDPQIVVPDNKKMTNSPFEQFEIIRIIPIHPFGNLDISVTNSTLFMIIAASFFLFIVNMEKGLLIPTR